MVNAAFAHIHRQVEPVYEAANTFTAVGMVRAGIAITVVPQIAIREMNMKGVRIARIYGPLQRREIGIMARLDRPLSSAAGAYVEFIFATVRKA